ncbi:Arc family DNA binding domain-containing protein [marine bacterium AO1-C]|nr:Arc family DNA binding domain-containing protein [marine bacterium AO1-C]
MAKKKAFALRISEEMMNSVEKWAADEFRSTNGQLEWIIHQALKKSGRLKPLNNQGDTEENAGDKTEE